MPLMISVVWRCEQCKAAMTALHEYSEGLFVPDGMFWVEDDTGPHILCPRHERQWRKRIEQANPEVMWLA